MVRDIEDLIIDKLDQKVLSEEEEKAFAQWYKQPENRKRYYEWKKMHSAIYANAKAGKTDTAAAWQKIVPLRQHSPFILRPIKYAAIILLFLGTALLAYLLQTPSKVTTISEKITVEPGKKQAVLTLSSGQQIALSDSIYQTVTKEKGTIIRNNAPNMLVYDPSEASQEIVYNTISIPRGGEYKLTLSDGTTVWLNSDSRLTFPVSFNGKTRELQLEGEAYFEVTKDPDKPFLVHTHQFDIRVTGTQFNVRTYPDEPESATLAEGGIQLEKDNRVHRLKPGQQAVVGEEVTIREVRLEEAIAWRHEAFCFKQCRLENILNELARWYDIEIFYVNPGLKDLHFTAWFQRSSSITEVIDILEKTQKIKLRLKGKTLTIAAK